MGTITAQAIINKAAIQLTDIGNTRWTRAELLDWLNQGQKQIVVMSPSATNKVSVVQLVAGTRQNIPSDGWTLLELIRYMGTNGSTPGRAIRVTSRELIDSFNPTWHAAAKSAVPKHYIFDQQDQTVFYVYPPNNGQGYVQINYAPVPPMITSESTVISISDTFEPVLLDYILYRACSKDAEYAPGLQLASGYLQTFMAAMQIKQTSELANSPNQNFTPKDPNKPGSES
jgi:hypothetical protein